MTVFSRPTNANSQEIMKAIKQQEKMWPPPIPFAKARSSKSKTTTKEKTSSASADDDDKTAYLTVEIKFNPDDEDSQTYEEKIRKYKGNKKPEQWVLYRKQMDELFEKSDIESADDGEVETRHHHYQATLRDKAKDEYTRAHNTRTAVNLALPAHEQLTDHAVQKMVINDVARKEFPNWKSAVRQQKHYMRTCLYMGDQDPAKFIERLNDMNDSLPYFPYLDGRQPANKMPDDELIDMVDSAKKFDWHLTMMEQGKRPTVSKR